MREHELKTYEGYDEEYIFERNDSIISKLVYKYGITDKQDVIDCADRLFDYVIESAYELLDGHHQYTASELFVSRGSKCPTVVINNRLKTSVGALHILERKIDLSGDLIRYGTLYDVVATLLHELAHAAFRIHTVMLHGNDGDLIFESLLYKIGADPGGIKLRGSGNFPVEVYRTGRRCCSHYSYTKLRRSRLYFCDCGEVFNYVGRMSLSEYDKLKYSGE